MRCTQKMSTQTKVYINIKCNQKVACFHFRKIYFLCSFLPHFSLNCQQFNELKLIDLFIAIYRALFLIDQLQTLTSLAITIIWVNILSKFANQISKISPIMWQVFHFETFRNKALLKSFLVVLQFDLKTFLLFLYFLFLVLNNLKPFNFLVWFIFDVFAIFGFIFIWSGCWKTHLGGLSTAVYGYFSKGYEKVLPFHFRAHQ